MTIKLDPQQKAIVESTADNICVIAGAGSGKTRVLIERVSHLLEKGEDPSSIVCITFTKLAAQEMQKRFKDIPGTEKMFIGTIHSLANSIYKTTGRSFKLLTPKEELRIMKELIEKYGKVVTLETYESWVEKRRLVDIGYMKKQELEAAFTDDELAELYRLLDYKDFSNRDNVTEEELTKEILTLEKAASISKDYPETVRSVAKKEHILTFNELLEVCQDVFLRQRRKIKYLFVDEFQDIGVFEYRFLTGLNAEHIFVVGDDYQAIYGFKGADFEYFKSLINNPKFTTYKLESNYRCNKKIVEYGNETIGQINDVIPKKCVSKATGRGQIIKEEGGIQTVLKYVKMIDPRDYGRWFILSRYKEPITDISRALYRIGIPTDTFRKSNISLSELTESLERNTIKILTVHASKGLEADNVILFGDFPDDPDDDWWKRHTTEGKRVMYVGITRARNNLVVVDSTKNWKKQ